MGLLLNNFGDGTGQRWGGGNLNSDANVDSIDLGRLLNNFGFESAVAVAASVADLALPEDVNGDGVVSPLDALRIVNALNSALPRSIATDVDGDGETTPLDALRVINRLNNVSDSADAFFAHFELDDEDDV